MTTPLIQHGQPRYGRFKSAPSAINIEDFKLQTPFERSISGLSASLKRQLGFKSFQFISINNQDVMIGLAIVDLGWVGNGFFYIYDKNDLKSASIQEISLLQPFAYQTHVGLPASQTQSSFQKGQFRIDIQSRNNKRVVKVTHAKQNLLEAVIETSETEPLALCSPTGATGWTYTQKQTAQIVHGQYLHHGQQFEISPAHGFLAATDDSCGFMNHKTSWHWLSVSATLKSGQRVGVNFAMGVNQTFGSENALWIDHQIFEIPPVMFERVKPTGLNDEPSWRIYSADSAIDLTVQTGWCRQESLNLGLVASHFNQWVAHVYGQINTDQHSVIFDGEMGLLEKHFAKW
ncbi:DUF2804 domain-containing protein [Aquirhabdus sp.]|uniref:DUF2804 domain-containing protein n=1 Tax=Aquirhabdus sp. TaxID=2824160 RepID=UPI00396C8974